MCASSIRSDAGVGFFERQKIGVFHRHAQPPIGNEPLTDLWNAFDSLSRHRLRPASEDRSERGMASKSMLGGNAHRGFRPLMRGMALPAELPEERGAVQRHRHAIGMRQILSQGKGLVHLLQRLVRIPQKPQGQGRPISASDAQILAIEGGEGLVLLTIVERYSRAPYVR